MGREEELRRDRRQGPADRLLGEIRGQAGAEDKEDRHPGQLIDRGRPGL